MGYERGIYLIYGVEAELDRIQSCVSELAVPIEVWFHPEVGTRARPVFTLQPDM